MKKYNKTLEVIQRSIYDDDKQTYALSFSSEFSGGLVAPFDRC